MEKVLLNERAAELAEKYFQIEDRQKLLNIDYRWNGRFRGKTAGVCRFKKNAQGVFEPAGIEISSKYMEMFPEMLVPVLLHEMIHAVLPWEEKHGRAFKTMASEMNQFLKEAGEELITVRISEEKAMPRNYKYEYECTRCGQIYRRVQNPIQLKKNVCGRCHGKLREINKNK